MNSAARKVVKDDRNLVGAYGMAFVGLVLGVFGMQRYYLKQRIYGTMMSAPFLVGAVLIAAHYASAVNDMLTGALAFGNSSNFADIPDIEQAFKKNLTQVYFGLAMCAAGGVWFIIDMVRLPSLVRAYREGR